MCRECESYEESYRENRPNRNRSCDKCVCDQLRRLRRGTEVDVFLSGGRILEDVIFLRFNDNNCCATFRDEEVERGTKIFVDCRDIVALRIE
ncbi:hydrolase [Mesobacillus thioparans]|uniref:hydrolase n=1 Tax=Mesobacillus thioparans TaxID=370439 RepID=UPI0039EF03DB